MLEEAGHIFDYLPFYFPREEEEEYVVFLRQAFESNYQNEKYQFAFIAYHMLFMTAVYALIWKIRLMSEHDFRKALIGFGKDNETQLLKASSPFTLHMLNERSVFRFFKLIGCDDSRIGRYQKIVDDRNQSAHSNGNIYLGDKESVDDKLTAILNYLQELQECFQNGLMDYYVDFLKKNCVPDDREYIDDKEQIDEVLLRPNYFSNKDIQCMLSYPVSRMSRSKNYSGMKALHKAMELAYDEI